MRNGGFINYMEELSVQLENGQLRPGDSIPSESEIAKHMNMSRRDARDALHTLQMVGILAKSRSEKRYILSEMGDFSKPLEKLVHIMLMMYRISPFEVCQLRRSLDLSAYPLAFRRREQLDLEELKGYMDIIECGNALYALQADKDFHMWLVCASGNQLMQVVLQSIWQVCSVQMNLVLADGLEEMHIAQVQTHMQMYKSFLRGDQAMGLAAIQSHYDTVEKVLQSKLGQ